MVIAKYESIMWQLLDIMEIYGAPRSTTEKELTEVLQNAMRDQYINGYNQCKRGKKLPQEHLNHMESRQNNQYTQ